MDFNDTPAESAFRAELRAWLRAHAERFAPPAGADEAEVFAISKAWQAALADAGLAGLGLPAEIGGRPGSPVLKIIFQQETAGHPMAKVEYLALGSGIAVPTLLAHGTPQQVARFARPTIRGEITWCQLFSEPGAGSDLAGVRTSAIRDGTDWVVNGQKVWTSGAHNADWGLLVARTDSSVPKHAGLSYFIVDMHSPGVEVRPLRQMSGRSEFNEVFLSGVRVPDELRVGAPGQGWKVAISTLANESLALTGNGAVSRNLIAPLIALARRIRSADGRAVTDDSAFRERIASYHAAAAGIEHIGNRITTALSRGENPGSEMYMGKMTVARLAQSMSEYGMDLVGLAGPSLAGSDDPALQEIQQSFFLAPGYRMGGGTEEIGKNIIAERVLGLPPDHRPDKNVPFNDLH